MTTFLRSNEKKFREMRPDHQRHLEDYPPTTRITIDAAGGLQIRTPHIFNPDYERVTKYCEVCKCRSATRLWDKHIKTPQHIHRKLSS